MELKIPGQEPRKTYPGEPGIIFKSQISCQRSPKTLRSTELTPKSCRAVCCYGK
jgi:hypothetical protein